MTAIIAGAILVGAYKIFVDKDKERESTKPVKFWDN